MSRIQGKKISSEGVKEQETIGIDVSKLYLDIYVHPQAICHRVTNDNVGLKRLVRLLRQYTMALVVMEATGRYHRFAHRHLSEAGFKVAVMNPYRTRKFADMLGKLAKTDKIDAKTLALFAAMVCPEATDPIAVTNPNA